ncbi:hypothetical protein BHE74_00012825 [Ensete ventricosum]|nr:hypothetical protein BHE74_00012825 [Ensete ventricosum]
MRPRWSAFKVQREIPFAGYNLRYLYLWAGGRPYRVHKCKWHPQSTRKYDRMPGTTLSSSRNLSRRDQRLTVRLHIVAWQCRVRRSYEEDFIVAGRGRHTRGDSIHCRGTSACRCDLTLLFLAKATDEGESRSWG